MGPAAVAIQNKTHGGRAQTVAGNLNTYQKQNPDGEPAQCSAHLDPDDQFSFGRAGEQRKNEKKITVLAKATGVKFMVRTYI
jgi:hypothetical protein